MEEIHVVTCFITNRQGKVLILRRSDRVRTYRGRWAAVAGYLEATPEEQAYTEVSEEAGLDRSDVELLARGEPLEVRDPDLDTLWIIHPFRFEVVDPARVRLDWEHTESRWIDPAEIGSFPTVPGLKEAYDAVRGFRK